MATNKTNRIENITIRLQSNEGKALVATWTHTLDSNKKSNLKCYSVRWDYKVGKIWYIGETSEVTPQQSLYTPPDIAVQVRVRVKFVRKKKYTKKKAKKNPPTSWFECPDPYYISDLRPDTASAPSISVLDNKRKIEVSIENVPQTGINKPAYVRFQIVKNDKTIVYDADPTYEVAAAHKKVPYIFPIKVNKNFASYTFTGEYGAKYKARAKYIDDEFQQSYEWSDWSSDVLTIPEPPKKVNNPKRITNSSVSLTWTKSSGATSYKVLYTTNAHYFNEAPDKVQSLTISNGTTALITGLDTGYNYYFSVCAVNEQGTSQRSTPAAKIVFGTKPDPPTTWSESTTALAGETVTIYWVHNSTDNSSQVKAEIELTINGKTKTIVVNNNRSEAEKDNTSSYVLGDTLSDQVLHLTVGEDIYWRVRTCGITGVFSGWSIKRLIRIYPVPILSFASSSFSTTSKGNALKKFPISLDIEAICSHQKPLTYYIEIIAASTYTGLDYVGSPDTVYKGDVVFSKIIKSSDTSVTYSIQPKDCYLESGQKYVINATASFNSGLTAKANPVSFYVAWDEEIPCPDLDMYIENEDLVSMAIQPFCENPKTGKLVSNVVLSVYRQEKDGKFTTIQTNIKNRYGATVIDPHPSLNNVTYRVVAKSTVTGEMSFNDVYSSMYFDGPIDSAVILQWDETYRSAGSTIDEELADELALANFIRLPYNIDFTSNHKPDVSLIKYIGREYPVSYYGTQLGDSSTCRVDISKDDEETLDKIRRLAVYTGDVYIREPSGLGYWAQIDVSYQRSYDKLVIPISLNITRVEGGK